MKDWLAVTVATMPEGVKIMVGFILGVLSYFFGVKLYENHLTIKLVKKEKGSDSVVVVSVKRWDRNAIAHFTELGYERSTKHG